MNDDERTRKRKEELEDSVRVICPIKTKMCHTRPPAKAHSDSVHHEVGEVRNREEKVIKI